MVSHSLHHPAFLDGASSSFSGRFSMLVLVHTNVSCFDIARYVFSQLGNFFSFGNTFQNHTGVVLSTHCFSFAEMHV